MGRLITQKSTISGPEALLRNLEYYKASGQSNLARRALDSIQSGLPCGLEVYKTYERVVPLQESSEAVSDGSKRNRRGTIEELCNPRKARLQCTLGYAIELPGRKPLILGV